MKTRERHWSVCGSATRSAADTVSVVDRPPKGMRNGHYTSNRAPLLPSPFAKLPIGSIRPEGWLRKQLENQASGMCGHLTEISAFCMKDGNAWLAENGEGHGWWEEVPYWLKGFGDLGYVLGDERIERETREWIEALLASQRADGWFGPVNSLRSTRNKSSIEGERVKGRPDMWPNALMLTVLRSNYEHTGDERVIKHMLNYCDWLIALPEKDYLIHWVGKRRGVELLKSILWLYNVTGEEKLLDLAHKTHRRTNDWTSGISRHHNVDFSECFYEPGLYYTLSKERKHYDAVERNRALIYDEFGQAPGGMFAGDERMRPGYGGPRQAVETCGMVEMMHSCELMLTQVDGDIKWADRCEDVAFNSYPAALTADMDAIRYLLAPNMPVGDRAGKNPDIDNSGAMVNFNPHAHRCCQHNHAHGWPYFAEYLWLATSDNGLCAMFYSESSVEAVVADGRKVSVKQETNYPFSDSVRFTFEGSAAFPFYLRVPGWSRNPSVKVNGKRLDTKGAAGRYVRIDRVWNSGDTVELVMPMAVDVRTWEQNNDCISVNRGPLTYSLKIGERVEQSDGRETVRQKKFLSDKANFTDWPAYENFPATPWNYGLLPEEGFEVVGGAWPGDNMPWTHAGSPVMLKAKAKKIPNWKLQANNLVGAMQQSPIRSDEPVETVELLPMGACRLRISAFPTIGNGADAKDWKQQEEIKAFRTGDGTRLTASFWSTEPHEKPEGLFDGPLPESSADRSARRMTFRPRQGTLEKVGLEFAEERVVNGIEVYWADDGAKGACRVPAKAELFYFTDDTWMPAYPESSVPVAKDKLNRLEIKPVSTTAIELRIQQKEAYSAGLMKLRAF